MADIQYYDVETKNLFAFYREKDGDVVKCIFNMSKRELTVDVSQMVNGNEKVLLHGYGPDCLELEEQAVADTSLSGEVTLQPWEYWILSE